MTGFKGYFNRLAGYAHSSDALRTVWHYLSGKGVKFVLGNETGKVDSLLYEGKKCWGIKTGDGKIHKAALTIVAAGAWSAHLVPAVGGFVAARCWSVAHVQLNETEADYLRGIPTTNVRDLGFFFEPDPKTKLFKLCPLGAGYTNTDKASGTSAPPNNTPAGQLPQPQDFIPAADEKKLRQLLRETFPWMAERPFVEQKLCWFADSSDSEFCIDFVPGSEQSVVVLSGDSGHGFKMMPVFGKWVVELLQQGRQKLDRWQWRETDLRGKAWGDNISWRIGKERELSDLVEEQAKTTSVQSRL